MKQDHAKITVVREARLESKEVTKVGKWLKKASTTLIYSHM